MEVLVVSNPAPVKNEAEILNRLFENDLPVLHLRKPGYSVSECRDLLKRINVMYHDRIALHQHHYLSNEFGICRFHYPEKLRRETYTLVKTEDQICSTSCHNLKDIMEISSGFDYVMMGPVFDSISKIGYKAMNNKDHPKMLKNRMFNIIGLGGITPGNGLKALSYGFDGLALMGYLWQQKDPANTYRTMMEQWNMTDPL